MRRRRTSKRRDEVGRRVRRVMGPPPAPLGAQVGPPPMVSGHPHEQNQDQRTLQRRHVRRLELGRLQYDPHLCERHHSEKDGKPVKWVFNRRDDFTFGSMDAMQTEYKVGMKLDGTITAVKVSTIFENMAIEAAGHLHENTRIPNLYSETYSSRSTRDPPMRCAASSSRRPPA